MVGGARAAAAFEALDADGSGSLSADELLAGLLRSGVGADDVAQLFAEIDTDRDGIVSREEFEAGFALWAGAAGGGAADSEEGEAEEEVVATREELDGRQREAAELLRRQLPALRAAVAASSKAGLGDVIDEELDAPQAVRDELYAVVTGQRTVLFRKELGLACVEARVDPSHAIHRAVSLRALERFVHEHDLEETNTSDVVAMLLDKHRGDIGTHFCELFDEAEVGTAHVFVSHAWGAPLGHLVACARSFCRRNLNFLRKGAVGRHPRTLGQYWEPAILTADDAFIWLDIFAIAQLGGAATAHDLNQLQGVVAGSLFTVVALAPDALERGPLTRTWCAYELGQTIDADRSGYAEKLQPEVIERSGAGWALSSAPIVRGLLDLDLSNARATFDEDRVAVAAKVDALSVKYFDWTQQEVKWSEGFIGVNAAVRARLERHAQHVESGLDGEGNPMPAGGAV